MAKDPFVGRKLGPYVLESLLGKGGMGTVYRSLDEAGKAYAVKVLPVDEESASSTMAARFKREIQACMNTRSVHVIRLFEAGTEDDCHWYSMELLEGKTLQQILKRRGRLPMKDVIRICRELSMALEHIHERGIIHRDLKPGNIMIVRSGRTVLMDFGLAKVADRTRITKTGHGLGTPRYMAPEMLLAKPPTPATDIYQMGVILYEMLTGQTVVKAKSFATLAHELTRVYPPDIMHLDPGLSPELDNLVFNCLEKDQKLRYQSAGEFLEDLDAYAEGRPVPRRGTGKTLKLGESSGEVDTAEITRVDGTSSRPTPRPPDSRPEAPRLKGAGRPRVSASFSSVAVGTEPAATGDGWRSHPLLASNGGRAGAFLVGLLAVLGLAWLGTSRWSGDTGVAAAPEVRVSPAGAEVLFETVSEVPGAVRLYRYVDDDGPRRLDEQTRVFQAEDEAARRRHRIVLTRLVEGRSYAAEVYFPDGSSRHRVEFRIPEQAVADRIRLDRSEPGKGVLSFRMGFPVTGRVRQESAREFEGIPFEGEPRTEWRVELPLADPFRPLEGVYFDLEGAAGWKQSFGPYPFPGLDGQAISSLEAIDVPGVLRQLENVHQVGGDLPGALKEQVRRLGIPETLQALRPHAATFFQRRALPYPRRRELFSALQRLAPIDFYCSARNVPSILDVGKYYADFVGIGTTSRHEAGGTGIPGDVPYRDGSASGERDVLQPVGVEPAAFQAALDGSRRLFGFVPRAIPQRRVTLDLPDPLPPQMDLELLVVNFYADYYLEIEFDDGLSLLLATPDPTKVLHQLGNEPPRAEDLQVRLVVRLPVGALHPGRNTAELRLHGFGRVGAFPTSVERFRVYFSRSGT